MRSSIAILRSCAVLVVLLAAVALAGCGNKGPLVKPGSEPVKPAPEATP